MDLQKVEDDEDNEAQETPAVSVDMEAQKSPSKDRKALFYRHPMRPEITSKAPAKDEMGMDYIPVYEDESATGKPTGVEGRAAFSLSVERQQLIGVTTTKVSVRSLSYEVRASGKVAFDPDLYTAVEEYREAIISRSQMSDSPLRVQADGLVLSAKTKLKLLGLGDEQIRSLGSGKTNSMNLLLPKGAVWVYAEVFEYEVAGLKAGLSVEVEAPSIPGKTFTGKVSSVSPVVSGPTRTIRIRALVPDPQGLLRPDTFMNVKIKLDIGEKLSIPEDAILHSGEQTFVFVSKEKGKLEPRAVRVGTKTQNYYEVVAGLVEGETVVTGANFLIDSESKIRGVLQNSSPARAAPRTEK